MVADRGHDYNEVSLKVAWDLGYSASGLYGPAGDFETIYFPNTRINWLGSIEGYFDALDYFVSQYY